MRLTGTETLPIVNVNLAEKLTSSHGRMRNSPSTMRPEFLGKALRSEPSSRRAHTDALGRKICVCWVQFPRKKVLMQTPWKRTLRQTLSKYDVQNANATAGATGRRDDVMTVCLPHAAQMRAMKTIR